MSQSLSQVYLHLIFSTKNRQPWLTEKIRPNVYAYMATIFQDNDSPALLIGGVKDHVHVLFQLHRGVSQAKIVEEVKKHSSRKIKTMSADDFSWQAGYGMLSVSQSQVGKVSAYIRNQAEHHRVTTFQEEYRAFLKKYRVAYDERYVWD